ncbi:hypothetical protein AVEN_49212-1, partial [Araneus ventricosus]
DRLEYVQLHDVSKKAEERSGLSLPGLTCWCTTLLVLNYSACPVFVVGFELKKKLGPVFWNQLPSQIFCVAEGDPEQDLYPFRRSSYGKGVLPPSRGSRLATGGPSSGPDGDPVGGDSQTASAGCRCLECPRVFSTLRGLGVHRSSKHPDSFHAEKLELLETSGKARWSKQEIERLGVAEATVRFQHPHATNINQLLNVFPGRTLESIKGRRSDATYKTLVNIELANLRAASVAPQRQGVSTSQDGLSVSCSVITPDLGTSTNEPIPVVQDEAVGVNVNETDFAVPFGDDTIIYNWAFEYLETLNGNHLIEGNELWLDTAITISKEFPSMALDLTEKYPLSVLTINPLKEKKCRKRNRKVVNDGKPISKRKLRRQDQFGFRPMDGIAEAIGKLDLAIRSCQYEMETLAISSLDLKKAFDTLKHSAIYISLRNAGVDANFC